MDKFSFESELWAQDDERVDMIVAYAKEQDEHHLRTLWFCISWDGSDATHKFNSKDAPSTYRLN